MWQDEDGRHEENQLTRQGKENALARIANALKESGGNDLHSDDGEHHHQTIQCVGRHLDQFRRTFGKEGGKRSGKEGSDAEANHRDGCACHQGDFQNTDDAVVVSSPEIVARNGLHALVQSDDDHDDKQNQAIRDAERPHGSVAAVGCQTTGHQRSHQTGTKVDEKLWQTDEQGFRHNFPFQVQDVAVQMDEFPLVGEKMDLPEQHHRLSRDGCQGSPLNSPVEDEDEDGRKDAVQNHRSNRCHHRFLRTVCGAQHGVQSEIEVSHDVSEQNDGHEVSGERQCLVACAEETKNRIDEEQKKQSESHAEYAIHDDHIAEDGLGCVIVLLSQFHAHESGCAHANHRAERCGQRHDGHGERQSHDGFRAHALTDEDAVDDVVNARGSHCNDGGNGVVQEQTPHGLLCKHVELIGFR